MVRTAIPGGRLTSDQLLAELDLCDEVGNTTLRITTRQGLQLHGVLKTNLKRTIQRINEVQLSTLAACGDVKRNVMCTPCPYNGDPVHEQMYELAGELVKQLNPRTRAYHQIWLTNGETGETHRCRRGRHSAGRSGRPGNAGRRSGRADLRQDLPAAQIQDRHRPAGRQQRRRVRQRHRPAWRFARTGTSWATTCWWAAASASRPARRKRFPPSRCRCATSTPTASVDLCIAIVKVQRDFGNRADRKVARMKYLIHNWGLDRFRAKVEEYFGDALAPLRPVGVHGFNDGMGWHEQGDGRWFYGLNIENGRIKDTETMRLKTALREICTTFRPPLRLTPHQSIIFCDIDAGGPRPAGGNPAPPRRAADRGLHGRPPLVDGLPRPAHVRPGGRRKRARHAVASSTNSKSSCEKLGLQDEVFTTRMTGCPNGCARPYNCDIGLVGKTKDKYTIFLGGRVLGDRLNFIYKDLVPTDEVVPTLVPVLRYFKEVAPERRIVRRFLPPHRQRCARGTLRRQFVDERRSGINSRPSEIE